MNLTRDEWELAIDFLTRTGQVCSDERQELILLSDTLGFSMLVDAINDRRPSGATENMVFGPFHLEGAPIRQMGDSICLDGKGGNPFALTPRSARRRTAPAEENAGRLKRPACRGAGRTPFDTRNDARPLSPPQKAGHEPGETG